VCLNLANCASNVIPMRYGKALTLLSFQYRMQILAFNSLLKLLTRADFVSIAGVIWRTTSVYVCSFATAP
jgi:hypothetical protein